MRAIVLNDGERFSDVAGCKLVDVDDAVQGDEVDTAIKTGDCVVLVEFDGTEGPGLAERSAFSATERERLHALLSEYAALHERLASLVHATEAEQTVYHRDAELLRRQAGVVGNEHAPASRGVRATR